MLVDLSEGYGDARGEQLQQTVGYPEFDGVSGSKDHFVELLAETVDCDGKSHFSEF